MQEKEIKLFDYEKQRRYTMEQAGSLFIMFIVFLIALRNHDGVHILMLLSISLALFVNIVFTIGYAIALKIEEEKANKIVLRCYLWSEYKEGTKNQKIYCDEKIYVESPCNDYQYAEFQYLYDSEEKVKELIYHTFHKFIK